MARCDAGEAPNRNAEHHRDGERESEEPPGGCDLDRVAASGIGVVIGGGPGEHAVADAVHRWRVAAHPPADSAAEQEMDGASRIARCQGEVAHGRPGHCYYSARMSVTIATPV